MKKWILQNKQGDTVLASLQSHLIADEWSPIILDSQSMLALWNSRANTLRIKSTDQSNIQLESVFFLRDIKKQNDPNEFGVEYHYFFRARGDAVFYSNTTQLMPHFDGIDFASAAQSEGQKLIKSPMTGKILKVNKQAGDKVGQGESLLVIEAMKMENQISAPTSGILEEMFVEVGQNVNTKDKLFSLKQQST